MMIPQDLKPRIHLTESDLASFDAGGVGGLCGEDGCIGAAEFEAAMRKQVRIPADSGLSFLPGCLLGPAVFKSCSNFIS